MVRRTKAEAEQTREMILDAAERLFADNGVPATSLDDIAREAGVTRGAIYWHFDGKIALFNEMQRRVKMPLDALAEKAFTDDQPLTALQNLCIYVLKYMARDMRAQRVFSIMVFGCEGGDMACIAQMQRQKRDETIEKFEGILKAARKKGELAPGITPRTAAIALHAYMSGLLTDYLRQPKEYPIDKQAKTLVSIFFEGLAA